MHESLQTVLTTQEAHKILEELKQDYNKDKVDEINKNLIKIWQPACKQDDTKPKYQKGQLKQTRYKSVLQENIKKSPSKQINSVTAQTNQNTEKKASKAHNSDILNKVLTDGKSWSKSCEVRRRQLHHNQ